MDAHLGQVSGDLEVKTPIFTRLCSLTQTSYTHTARFSDNPHTMG